MHQEGLDSKKMLHIILNLSSIGPERNVSLPQYKESNFDKQHHHNWRLRIRDLTEESKAKYQSWAQFYHLFLFFKKGKHEWREQQISKILYLFNKLLQSKKKLFFNFITGRQTTLKCQKWWRKTGGADFSFETFFNSKIVSYWQEQVIWW